MIEYEASSQDEEWQDAVSDMLSYLMIIISRYINSSIKNIPFGSCDEWNTVSDAINIIRKEYGNSSLSLKKKLQKDFT